MRRWLPLAALVLWVLLFGVAFAAPLAVLREVAMWKLHPGEEVHAAYFSCTMAPQYCEKLGLGDSSGGFYKAYFKDGFVLTLLASGDVVEHYYMPSEINMEDFRDNLERYGSEGFNFSQFPEPVMKRLSVRVEDMRKWGR